MNARKGVPIDNQVTGDDLGALEQFKELGKKNRKKLAALARRQHYPENTVLFRDGDYSDSVYIVLSGRVSLCTRLEDGRELCYMAGDPGEMLGWSGLFPGWNRIAGARTMEPTELLWFPADSLWNLCDKDHDIGYVIMRAALQETAERLHDTRIQLHDVYATD